MIVRSLEMKDFGAWLPLWNGNNQGVINEKVTTETWARICDDKSPVHGLGAFEGAEMKGLVHYVLHPTTGALEPVCYMQDLYVDPAHRKKGIGRTLVEELAKIGKKKNWTRLYWMAESKNEAAQRLYESMGIKLDFTLHIMPLGMKL